MVSDFDTFTVGCRGIRHEPTPPEQVELIHWALDRTAELLKQDNSKGWTGHWLDVLKVENAKGFHPNLPEFGFGDPTSYRFVEDVVSELKDSPDPNLNPNPNPNPNSNRHPNPNPNNLTTLTR